MVIRGMVYHCHAHIYPHYWISSFTGQLWRQTNHTRTFFFFGIDQGHPSTGCGRFHIVDPTEKTVLRELSEDFVLPQLPEFPPQWTYEDSLLDTSFSTFWHPKILRL